MPLKKTLTLLSALSTLFVSACTEVGLGVANLPAKFSGTEIKKDISFGDDPVQKLDIYIPKNAKEKSAPVLVFFYGGRWTDGQKDQYAFVAQSYAKQGYVVVVPDYRKYPNVKFPAFVEDGAKAIAWTYKNIEKYHGNKENLYVSGHSSGAHIGALVTANPNYLAAEGLTPNIINAFAGLAGPYDFEPGEADLKDMFGPPSNYPNMQVTTFINGDEPPKLLLWGEKDDTVWARNHKLLSKKIKEEVGDVKVITYKELDHVGIVSSYTWFLNLDNQVLKDTLEFFDKYKN